MKVTAQPGKEFKFEFESPWEYFMFPVSRMVMRVSSVPLPPGYRILYRYGDQASGVFPAVRWWVIPFFALFCEAKACLFFAWWYPARLLWKAGYLERREGERVHWWWISRLRLKRKRP